MHRHPLGDAPVSGSSFRLQAERLKSVELAESHRMRNESIAIDDDIVVAVIEIRGDKVRLGIQARRDRSVHRQEVWQAIRHERDAAAPALPAAPASPMPDWTVFG
jgi:carbon storage regulator